MFFNQVTFDMDSMESSAEDWVVNCSDEELGEEAKKVGKSWELTPEEIVTMFELIESKGALELDWQCPGRRSPTVNSPQADSAEKETNFSEDNKATAEPNEFDFDDEFSSVKSTPKITAMKRVQSTSAKKRVARLDKVMFDIQRHRKLDELEQQKQSPKSTNNSPVS